MKFLEHSAEAHKYVEGVKVNPKASLKIGGDEPLLRSISSHNCLVSHNLSGSQIQSKRLVWIFRAGHPDPTATCRLELSLAGRSTEMATDLTRLGTP